MYTLELIQHQQRIMELEEACEYANTDFDLLELHKELAYERRKLKEITEAQEATV